MSNYKSTLSIDNAKKRADLIHRIRSFFHARNILEVETPIVSRASGLDPYIDVYCSEHGIDGSQAPKENVFLSTSPEFFMKRMLASGYPSIFQLCKAFRNGEVGNIHNPEFTILEWYRIDMSFKELIQETVDLVNALKDFGEHSVITYTEAFEKYVSVNPFDLTIEKCKILCAHKNIPQIDSDSMDEWLIYVLSQCIEPYLGAEGPEVLSEYPASQAALAQTFINDSGNEVAKRFELYINGVELCNGYEELTDPVEQRRRFDADSESRKNMQKEPLMRDRLFLDALESGLPACSGVAVGVDRLIMLTMGEKDLSKVLSFPFDRC